MSFARSGHQPARRLLSFVHQDLGLVPTATVVETFGVGRYLTGLGRRISWRRERARLAAALARFGVCLPPDRTIAEIPVTDRAILAIARAFDRLADQRQGVLVLDEPTAFLPRDGVERVCEAIATVARCGVGVLLVTHNIPQALTITQRITVLRDGHRVLEEPTTTLTTQQLVTAMVTSTAGQSASTPRNQAPRREVLLRVRDLGGQAICGVSFDVRAGEIVGLTGLMGSGFDHIPHLLFGATPARAGSASLHGKALPLARLTPARAIRAGLCLVPGDRAGQAAVLDAPAADNITLGNLSRHVRRGLLRQDSIVAHASALMNHAGVAPLTPRRDLATFSGECGPGSRVDPAALEFLAARAGGDARTALNALELACQTAGPDGAVGLEHAEDALQLRALLYDRQADRHYDTISAWIKATRGSDPDASLYYLAVMLEGGEDPRFIVRRMVVLASEDIGNADPNALSVATAAAAAVEHVGMPEAQFALAQAAIYLSLAPKSDAAKRAVISSREYIREHGAEVPPPWLRSSTRSDGGYDNPHRRPG
ncbi:MAG: hypothetical protein ACRDSH_08040, partial [Pseudonocardiaceae bacterium]